MIEIIQNIAVNLHILLVTRAVLIRIGKKMKEWINSIDLQVLVPTNARQSVKYCKILWKATNNYMLNIREIKDTVIKLLPTICIAKCQVGGVFKQHFKVIQINGWPISCRHQNISVVNHFISLSWTHIHKQWSRIMVQILKNPINQIWNEFYVTWQVASLLDCHSIFSGSDLYNKPQLFLAYIILVCGRLRLPITWFWYNVISHLFPWMIIAANQ